MAMPFRARSLALRVEPLRVSPVPAAVAIAYGDKMMRCDNCAHWKLAETDWQAERVGFKRCEAIREQWRITENATKHVAYPHRPCDEPIGATIPDDRQAALDAYESIQDNALKDAKAYVIDGSQYMAELWTGPDFFCAKFEARGIPTEGGDACGSVHG